MHAPPPPFIADGRRIDLARHGLRQTGLAMALPLALYLVFRTPLSGLLTMAAVGVGLTVLLTWGRLAWGSAVTFLPDGGTRILRRDGSTLELPPGSLLRVKADCIAFVWQDNGKRRSLFIGQEGFARATWALVHAAAQAQQQLAAASPVTSQPAA